MKRAFQLTTDRHLVSALVPEATLDALHMGTRLATTRPISLGGVCLASGERGTIDCVDRDTGSIEVLMDKRHRGLDAWHNHVLLEPYGTEDILDGFKVSQGRDVRVSFRRVPRWASAVGCAVVAGLIIAGMPEVEPFYTFTRVVLWSLAVAVPFLLA